MRQASDSTLRDVADILGGSFCELLKEQCSDRKELVQTLLSELSSIREDQERKEDRANKLDAFCVYAIYYLEKWNKRGEEAFREWGTENGLSSSLTAFMISLIREFRSWEPLSPEELARLIKLDRAIVRSARVAAQKQDPGGFYNWIERNTEFLTHPGEILPRIEEIVTLLESGSLNSLEREQAVRSLRFMSQRILLRVGEQYGRTGLNSVRRQIGAPPSARRPSRACVGAEFSNKVYELVEAYRALGASEREAFKGLIQRVDKRVERRQIGKAA